jgi:hypothetical protein
MTASDVAWQIIERRLRLEADFPRRRGDPGEPS